MDNQLKNTSDEGVEALWKKKMREEWEGKETAERKKFEKEKKEGRGRSDEWEKVRREGSERAFQEALRVAEEEARGQYPWRHNYAKALLIDNDIGHTRRCRPYSLLGRKSDVYCAASACVWYDPICVDNCYLCAVLEIKGILRGRDSTSN